MAKLEPHSRQLEGKLEVIGRGSEGRLGNLLAWKKAKPREVYLVSLSA